MHRVKVAEVSCSSPGAPDARRDRLPAPAAGRPVRSRPRRGIICVMGGAVSPIEPAAPPAPRPSVRPAWLLLGAAGLLLVGALAGATLWGRPDPATGALPAGEPSRPVPRRHHPRRRVEHRQARDAVLRLRARGGRDPGPRRVPAGAPRPRRRAMMPQRVPAPPPRRVPAAALRGAGRRARRRPRPAAAPPLSPRAAWPSSRPLPVPAGTRYTPATLATLG